MREFQVSIFHLYSLHILNDRVCFKIHLVKFLFTSKSLEVDGFSSDGNTKDNWGLLLGGKCLVAPVLFISLVGLLEMLE